LTTWQEGEFFRTTTWLKKDHRPNSELIANRTSETDRIRRANRGKKVPAALVEKVLLREALGELQKSTFSKL